MADGLGGQLLLQVALIGVNAFFASAEMSVVSLNTTLLKKKAEDGDKKAAKLLKLAEEPTAFLSAIQIAITLAGFLGSAFAAENFSDRLVGWLCKISTFAASHAETVDALSVIVITLILSYFTLVLGELVPKRVAMHSPEKVARITSPVVSGFKVVAKPVIWFLTKSTNAVLRLFGIKPDAQEESVTEDEIRLLVDAGEESGTIDAMASEMIDNIFEFDNRAARDVMTHAIDVIAISTDMDDAQIISLLRTSAYSRYPVCGEDINDVLGILYAKDFFLDRLGEGENKPLSELMRPAYFVPETVKCDTLFYEMQKSQRHLAVIVDEYGAVSGIITLEDLVEEVMGNIYDEYDSEEKEEEETKIESIGDGKWRADGSLEIDVFCECVGITLPEGAEFDTLAGMILSELSEIPEDGSTFEVDCYGLNIKVEKVEERRIESVVITRLSEAE